MIYMNSVCGKLLNQRGVGIFREVVSNPLEESHLTLDTLPLNTKTLLKNWKTNSGQYKNYSSDSAIQHSAMKKESYVHITSPIRRLVDLLNQIIFQKEFALVNVERFEYAGALVKTEISEEAKVFLNTWQSKLGEINEKMKSIKKVQIDCDLLNRCTAHPEWMMHPHRGIIFDRFETSDGNYSYTVHLSELNMLGRITTQEKYVNYQLLDFRLFVFQDSDKLCRKIRLTSV